MKPIYLLCIQLMKKMLSTDQIQLTSAAATTTENGATACNEEIIELWAAVFIPIVYFLIFAVGVVGNGVVIWILAKRDRSGMAAYQQSTTNLYVINLAVADINFVGVLPLWSVQYLLNGR